MKTLVTAFLTLALAGCFYTADRGKQLEARVDTLDASNKDLAVQLTREKDQLATELPKLQASVLAMQARLDRLDHASRTSDADVGVQMEAVRDDLAKLRGSVEEYQHRIDGLDAGLKQLGDSTDAKFAASKGPEFLKQFQAQKSAATLVRPTDKNEYLKLADAQLAAGKTDIAAILYGELVQKWPKDPLAARAHLALGRISQKQSHPREALAEFGEVVRNFSKTESAAPALLGSSESFSALGMSSESKLALEELAKDYPTTKEGKTAKAKLKKHTTKKGR